MTTRTEPDTMRVGAFACASYWRAVKALVDRAAGTAGHSQHAGELARGCPDADARVDVRTPNEKKNICSSVMPFLPDTVCRTETECKTKCTVPEIPPAIRECISLGARLVWDEMS
jgi:hypothetical protein